MKKTNTILFILVILVAIALVFAVIRFFILPGNGKTPVQPTETVTTAATEAPVATEEPTTEPRDTVTEGVTTVGTDSADTMLVDLTGGGSESVRIETVGPLEYKTPERVPEFYFSVTAHDTEEPLWAYQNTEGAVCLRAYGTRWKKVNNVNQEELTGFYDVELNENQEGKPRITVKSLVGAEAEQSAAAVPERSAEAAAPEGKYHEMSANLYACVTKAGTLEYRTYASVNGNERLYPCNENGEIRKGSIPVLPEEENANLVDYTEGFVPENADYAYPGQYRQTVLTISD